MGSMGCVPTTTLVTELLKRPDVQECWRNLHARRAATSEYVETMCRLAPPAIAATMREEFSVLPALTVTALVEAWLLADAGGKSFQFASVAPGEPITFARRRRVRLTVDVEEDRVTLALSHVPSRHAGWYGHSDERAVRESFASAAS
jgi:hypothetical protein